MNRRNFLTGAIASMEYISGVISEYKFIQFVFTYQHAWNFKIV